MGGGSSKKVYPIGTVTTSERKAMNRTIEAKLIAAQESENASVKVLLLGAGECGKSTILKQMKILHLNGFTDSETQEYKTLVRKNTLEAIQSLCFACKDLRISFSTGANAKAAESILAVDPSANLQLSLKSTICGLWKDTGIQEAVERENEFHMLDSAPYFLQEVDRTFKDDYVPTLQDILRSRLTTTGIIETPFTIDNVRFKMYDVGGQRGERKQWIHCFDDVTAIMYIASLSEYDQVLAEDRKRNRLSESLDLFEGIINLPWFEKAAVILFLNKNDLFEKKIKKVDIGLFHPGYNGGCDYKKGLAYIQEEYEDRNEIEDKDIYVHVTDGTNTDNVAYVWRATKHIVLTSKLTDSGLQMC